MPKAYQHIILAVELDPESDAFLVKRTKELLQDYNADLTVIHAIEHNSNYGAAYGVMAGVDVEEMLVEEASKNMDALLKELDIANCKHVIKIGVAKQVILEEAENVGADLIISGSHGRSGVALLLGSTANAILHGAHCDVLAVRVPS
ncbi:MAG: universal stress protein [Coxiellaceae bacterium]|nr:universal stress protein [Coxiellaceae bacterium]